MALVYKFWFPGPLPDTLHQNFQEKKKKEKQIYIYAAETAVENVC